MENSPFDTIPPSLSLRSNLVNIAFQNVPGCQAVEYDNLDCWQNSCVSGLKAGDSAMYQYQLTYNRYLFYLAHRYGMAALLKVYIFFLLTGRCLQRVSLLSWWFVSAKCCNIRKNRRKVKLSAFLLQGVGSTRA